MDIAIELAKCREAAGKVTANLALNSGCVFVERITTALLEARADTLRTAMGEMPEMYRDWLRIPAEELQREVHDRRLRGL
jgi:hypothetical protein